MKPPSRLPSAFVWIVASGFVAWAAAFILRTSFVAFDGHRYFSLFDDAMISMRYAWNFSHGMGLVWNAGERVQGYTNLLMTLVMSIATAIWDRPGAVLAIQILGVGLMLASAMFATRIVDHLTSDLEDGRRQTIGAVVFLSVLGYYPLVFWSLLGMETGLLALLLTSGVLAAFAFERTGETTYVLLSSTVFGLAVLTRTDAVIFAGLTWLYLAWTAATDRKPRALEHVALFMAVVGIFAIGQTAFQYAYYGEPLPNTYTLKITGMPLGERLANGAGFMWPFVKESVLILALAVAGFWLRRRPAAALLLAQLGAAMAYETYVGGDPWNYWRIMAPTMPLAFVLVVVVLDEAATRLAPVRHHAVVMVAATVVVLLSASVRFLPELSLLYAPMQTANAAENVETALVLERVTYDDATIAVLFAGAIPYYLDRRAIDLLGKSDRHIAHLPPDLSGSISWSGMKSVPGHNKYDLDYSIKQLEPTYVQIMQWGRNDLSDWAPSRYVQVEQDGVRLWLLRGASAVRWSALTTD